MHLMGISFITLFCVYEKEIDDECLYAMLLHKNFYN